MFDIHVADLRKVNSLTKYPSIPTHHALDPKNGGLLEQPTEYHWSVIGTEKVDGTNARVILLPDGNWLIGSREDLLTSCGDLIHNPVLGIVDTLRDFADHALDAAEVDWDAMVVLYLEVYGSKQLPAWKHYGTGEASYRLFDMATVPLDLLTWDIEKIASWRQNGGQHFFDEQTLQAAVSVYGVDLTPRLFEIPASDLPSDIEGMRTFMEPYRTTRVATSGDGGLNEGIVLRSIDRSVITKARFQDYDRTLKRR